MSQVLSGIPTHSPVATSIIYAQLSFKWSLCIIRKGKENLQIYKGPRELFSMVPSVELATLYIGMFIPKL